ncbi:class I SAM-dependent methyltransferase [Zhengella mangrovi]|nr:class I SAM-dependent methyltransferase [Zhengella mangrovi]
MLSVSEARRFYDRFGARQDNQGFYEDKALDALVLESGFDAAEHILEIGCGTGKFAARLFEETLAGTAHYLGTDISETMLGLARARLKPWGNRATVQPSDGGTDLSSLGAGFDRAVLTYVFDLMPEESIARLLSAIHGALRPGGQICIAGLTWGTGPASMVTSSIWNRVHALKPSLVGGCRPLDMSGFVTAPRWRIMHREVVVAMTVPSEVLVAEAL